jgi:hypothetical protein
MPYIPREWMRTYLCEEDGVEASDMAVRILCVMPVGAGRFNACDVARWLHYRETSARYEENLDRIDLALDELEKSGHLVPQKV